MKICFLTERMKLGFGVDLVVDEQARRLADRGYEVVVVVIHADLSLPPRPYRLVVLNRLIPLGDFYSPVWIRHALDQCRIDADLWILQTPPFYDWAAHLDGPVVFVEHGAPPGKLFSRETGRHIDGMVARRFEDVYGGLLSCDAIVSISWSIHNWLPQAAQAYSTVIHHGADHYPRISSTQARDLRSRIGISDDECMILWVGRMQLDHDEQPYKGLKELLALLPLLEQHVINTRFVLAGRISEDDKSKLQNRGLTILPNLTSEELACAYSAADLLINLSEWEGFNLALLEAQYQGTPVIAYDLGPHPEIVRDGETGLLAKNPIGFFQAIVKVANDKAFRNGLAERALALADRFTWDKAAAQLADVIEACAARGPSRAEIAEQRCAALQARKVAPAEEVSEISTAGDLLALEGRAFVRAARQMLLEQSASESAEAYWLRKLRRGAGKDLVLLQLVEIARFRGTYRVIPGLDSRVRRARIREWLRRMSGAGDVAAADRAEWLELQDGLFVQHAYRVLLGREAEPQAIVGYSAQLRQGRPRAAILADIHFSQEGRNRLIEDPGLHQLLVPAILEHLMTAPVQQPAPSAPETEWSRRQDFLDDLLRLWRSPSSSRWYRMANDELVRNAYRVLLGREAEPAAVEGRVAQLLGGHDRRALLAEIRFSDEGRVRPLTDRDLRRILRPDILKRRPAEPPRLPVRPLGERWRESVGNVLALGRALPFSHWFRLDDDEFIRHAYRVLLGREAEPAAVGQLAAQLRDGRSRRSILAEIRFSEEGRKRPLLEPRLRRMLFAESLRRSRLARWLLPARPPGDTEPEDRNRQLRRIESQHRAIAATLNRFEGVLAGTAQQAQGIGAVLGRLDSLEAQIAGLAAGPASQPALPAADIALPPSRFSIPYGPPLPLPRLGGNHVALVAPGTTIDATALPRLAEAAQSTGSDLVFGDEFERSGDHGLRRLRLHGPFSHAAFLRNPDLGGVIAVHEHLLEQLQWPPTVALTGSVVLQLVGLTHSITHLPVPLGERTSADIAANRPPLADMQAYADQVERRVQVLPDRAGLFDVRFPTLERWKVAIIVVVQDGRAGVESALTALRERTPPHEFHLVVVRAAEPSETHREGEVSPGGSGRTDLILPAGTPYGRMVSEAERHAPPDCNLVAIMDGGVAPLASDWLERLAESALGPDTGAVAPRTVYPDHRIRHAGIALGWGEPFGYVSRFAILPDTPDDAQDTDLDRLNGPRDVFAVSRHCMVVRRSVFRDQGRFSETLGPETADVEFCCRLHLAGLSVLLDGRVVMVQPDPWPRWARTVPPAELAAIRSQHGHMLSGEDRYWTPSRRMSDIRTTFLPPIEDR